MRRLGDLFRLLSRELMKRERALLIALLVGLFAVVLLRSAWLSDDAFITFRTVVNFADGHGLTWNVGERVQAYTNPLWLFLVSAGYFYTGEFYFTALVLSIAISVLCVALLNAGISRSLAAGLLGITILTLSKAFVDYSTSGLENPLTHLLLVLFCLVLLGGQVDRRRLFLLSLIAAMGVLNRMDAGLLFLPGLLMAFWTAWRPALGSHREKMPLRVALGAVAQRGAVARRGGRTVAGVDHDQSALRLVERVDVLSVAADGDLVSILFLDQLDVAQLDHAGFVRGLLRVLRDHIFC